MSSEVQRDTAAAGEPARTRTYHWDDPLIPARAAQDMSGLELMRAIVAGDLPKPPIAHTLGFDLVEVDRGQAVFHVRTAESRSVA